MTIALSSYFLASFLASLALFLPCLLAHRLLPPSWAKKLWLLFVLKLILPLGFLDPILPLQNGNKLTTIISMSATAPENHIPVSRSLANTSENSSHPGQERTSRQGIGNGRTVIIAILAIIILGQLVFIGLFLAGLYMTKKTVKKLRPLKEPALLNALEEIKQGLGFNKDIELYACDSVSSPSSFSFSGNAILIPDVHLGSLKTGELRDVLAHEVGHLMARDSLALCFINIALALFWFNPLLWLARRSYMEAAEWSCDSKTVQVFGNGSGLQYARSILKTAELVPATRYASLPLTAQILGTKTCLSRRIFMLFKPRKTDKWRVIAAILIVAPVFALAFSSLSCSAPVKSKANTEEILADDEARSLAVDTKNQLVMYSELPFRDDNRLIGIWYSVDIVQSIDDWKVGSRLYRGKIPIESFGLMHIPEKRTITIIQTGPNYGSKNLAPNLDSDPGSEDEETGTDSPKDKGYYEIRTYNGRDYLFVLGKRERDDGSEEHGYYVFKRIDRNDKKEFSEYESIGWSW